MSESERNRDRRRFKRIPFETMVSITTGSQNVVEGELRDISLKGILVGELSNWQPSVGDVVDVEIKLKESEQSKPEISLEAKVKHEDEEKVGMAWKTIDGDSFSHLRRLLELNTGNPEKIERELDVLWQ